MKVRVRIGRGAIAWLATHPELDAPFRVAVQRVFSSEETVIEETRPAFGPGYRHMHRSFRFADDFIGIFEWKPAEQSARVHTCLKRPLPPRPPAA